MSPIFIDIMNIIELRSSRFMTHVGEIMISVEGVTRELKKLRRLVQRKRHMKLRFALGEVFYDYTMLVTLCQIGKVYFR